MGHAISCVFYCGSMRPWGGPYPMRGHAGRTSCMHRETARANTNRPVTTMACKLLVTIYLLSSPPPVSPLFHRRKSSHRIVLVSFHTPPTQMQSSPNTRIPPLKNINIFSSISCLSVHLPPFCTCTFPLSIAFLFLARALSLSSTHL